LEAVYIDHMGSDDRVVDAARVSFSKLAENYTPDQNKKLIAYLAKNNHWTPFGHPTITIKEKVPIFVARQRFKHFVGFVYNEVSRRYVDDDPEFFTPDKWRKRPDDGIKQGSHPDEFILRLEWEIEKEWIDPCQRVEYSYEDIDKAYSQFINHSKWLYKTMIDNDVAPEQARMVLPQSLYTEYWVTGSLAAWARAYKLRIDPHAQKEIQDLAVQWDKIIRPLYPYSWSALVD